MTTRPSEAEVRARAALLGCGVESGSTQMECVGWARAPSYIRIAPFCLVSMRKSLFCVPPQKKLVASCGSQHVLHTCVCV